MNTLTYEEGLFRKKELAKKYDKQMDITCLNSKEFTDGADSNEYKQLFHKVSEFVLHFKDRIVFSQSEFHTEEFPFYETFLFCTEDEHDFFFKQVTDYDLIILYTTETEFYNKME